MDGRQNYTSSSVNKGFEMIKEIKVVSGMILEKLANERDEYNLLPFIIRMVGILLQITTKR